MYLRGADGMILIPRDPFLTKEQEMLLTLTVIDGIRPRFNDFCREEVRKLEDAGIAVEYHFGAFTHYN